MINIKTAYGKAHTKYSQTRRVDVISNKLAKLIPVNSRVLDVGCGGGEIAHQVSLQSPTTKFTGIDIDQRKNSKIKVIRFDGINIPFNENEFDYSIVVDVLHHTIDPVGLLREALRVSNHGVIIKDHNCNSTVQKIIMIMTDTLGNWHHDVPLLFNFFSRKMWLNTWTTLGVIEEKYNCRLGIYSPIRGCIFASDMDFISVIKKGNR